MDYTDDVLRRRALKAAKQKARRALNPNYVAREDSLAARLRREGVSADAYHAKLRRERLRAEKARDGVSCPASDPAPRVVLPISDGISCQPAPLDHLDGNSCRLPEGVSDGNSCSPWSPETADLIRRVRVLPGGRDPSLLVSLARISADAPAARAAWGECDPELAALLAAED